MIEKRMAPAQKVILAVVTDMRPDMTLSCCVSLLQLQMSLMTSQEGNGFQADLRFYGTFNAAITDLYKCKDFTAGFIIRYSAGVPGEFATKAFRSSHDLVFGIHPIRTIDWDRVRKEIASTTEELSHTGIVYNMDINAPVGTDGFAIIKEIRECDVLFVKRSCSMTSQSACRPCCPRTKNTALSSWKGCTMGSTRQRFNGFWHCTESLPMRMRTYSAPSP